MEQLQQRLDFLLEKYGVDTPARLLDREQVAVAGRTLPLLAHRQERRFIELRNMAQNGTLQGVSVMRTARTVVRGSDLYAQLYRELDLCRFILERTLIDLAVMESPGVLNAVATTADGVVCTLELAATLPAGEEPKDKHEIIAAHGIACDVVVDAQLRQDSIYLFGEGGSRRYTDVDFELYGLRPEDAATVRAAFVLARDKNYDAVEQNHRELTALVELARKAARSGEREVL